MYSPTPNPSEVHVPLKIYPVTEMYFGESFIDILNNIRACKREIWFESESLLVGWEVACNGCASKDVNFLKSLMVGLPKKTALASVCK